MQETNINEKYGLGGPANKAEHLSVEYYKLQQHQLWVAEEYSVVEDKDDYITLTKNEKRLYKSILMFFIFGDGMVCDNIKKIQDNVGSFRESMFYNIQTYIETVHAQSYSNSMINVIDSKREIEEIEKASKSVKCIQEKADFIMLNINNDDVPLKIRYIFAACTEGVFFVSLFAMVYYFNIINKMTQFRFLNEQVSKDETLHRDFYCKMAKLCNFSDEEIQKAKEIIKSSAEIEIRNIMYMLEVPFNSIEVDKINGYTLENLSLYVKTLANDISVMSGLGELYHIKEFEGLPWMNMYGVSKKHNFYEKDGGNYDNGGNKERVVNDGSLNIELLLDDEI